MNDPDLSELKLAGYVRMTARGFALPCFAADPRSNTWYTATCSVDADHAGQITGFDVFQSDDLIRLPEELQRTVRIGAEWTDVFLWKDAVLVGTPVDIWNALQSERDEMLSAVPLTGLDLALSIPGQNVAALIGSALEFMRGCFGTEHAESWKSGILARQQMLIALRRLARETGLSAEIQAAIGGLEIAPAADNQFDVHIPQRVADAFATQNRTAELNSRIRETTDRLGIVLSDPEEPLAEELLTPPPNETEPDVEDSYVTESAEAVRILIVVSEGKRARDIARHISYPDWAPDWLTGRRIVLEIESKWPEALEPSRKFIGDWRDDDEFSGEYDVIVLLADDEIANARGALAALLNSERGRVRLVAPALPEDTPSSILTGERPGGADFDALIDTSLARSPFWISNSRRALDRRIADVLVAAALLCSGDSEVRKQFKYTSRGPGVVLTFGFSRGGKSAPLSLSSESSSVEKGSAWKTRFMARDRGSKTEQLIEGVAQIRARQAHFEDFAWAVLRNAVSEEITSRPWSKITLPARLWRELTRPDLTLGFELAGRKRPRAVAICAEAPTLDAVRIAGSEGWAILRYTDEESLRELVNTRSAVRWPFLPRQLRLPGIQRRAENKGLATRGVDPRDIIRFTRDDWRTWKSRLPRSLGLEIRQYRTSLSRPDPDTDETLELVLPRRAVQQAVEAGKENAETFLEYIDRRDRRAQRDLKAGKRLADLRVAWSRPPDGISRYILSDGIIPCEFAELEPEEVPAQRFFIIDGDVGVPALLGSRVFAVWAKLTLRRSTSWMSRFSISQTFETFPIVSPFVVERRGDGSVHLAIEPRNRLLHNLSRKLQVMYRRQSNQSAQQLQAEIDKAILSRLDLKENASDLQILERLLQESGIPLH
jgi:hypothetical protein